MYSLPYCNDVKLLKLKDESDIFLTNEVKAGNEDAFKILAERYGYIIAYNISKFSNTYAPSHFHKCAAAKEKEDLFQECFIVLYKAAKYYDLMKNVKFSTYANACVKNYLISFYRKYYRKYGEKNCEIISIEDIPESECGICDRYFILGDINELNIIRNICKILTDFEKKVFLMYIERKSYKYIAEILNKNVKSIDNAVCRIKIKLRPYGKSFIADY